MPGVIDDIARCWQDQLIVAPDEIGSSALWCLEWNLNLPSRKVPLHLALVWIFFLPLSSFAWQRGPDRVGAPRQEVGQLGQRNARGERASQLGWVGASLIPSRGSYKYTRAYKSRLFLFLSLLMALAWNFVILGTPRKRAPRLEHCITLLVQTTKSLSRLRSQHLGSKAIRYALEKRILALLGLVMRYGSYAFWFSQKIRGRRTSCSSALLSRLSNSGGGMINHGQLLFWRSRPGRPGRSCVAWNLREFGTVSIEFFLSSASYIKEERPTVPCACIISGKDWLAPPFGLGTIDLHVSARPPMGSVLGTCRVKPPLVKRGICEEASASAGTFAHWPIHACEDPRHFQKGSHCAPCTNRSKGVSTQGSEKRGGSPCERCNSILQMLPRKMRQRRKR